MHTGLHLLVAGDGDDGNVFRVQAALHCCNQLKAVHVRHFKISDDDCKARLGNRLKRLNTVVGSHYLVAMRLEQLAQLGARHGRVVYHQDADARWRTAKVGATNAQVNAAARRDADAVVRHQGG